MLILYKYSAAIGIPFTILYLLIVQSAGDPAIDQPVGKGHEDTKQLILIRMNYTNDQTSEVYKINEEKLWFEDYKLTHPHFGMIDGSFV